MTRRSVVLLFLLVVPCLMAGCGSAQPPRMKNAPAVEPDSIEVKDKVINGAGKKAMPRGAEEKMAR